MTLVIQRVAALQFCKYVYCSPYRVEFAVTSTKSASGGSRPIVLGGARLGPVIS